MLRCRAVLADEDGRVQGDQQVGDLLWQPYHTQGHLYRTARKLYRFQDLAPGSHGSGGCCTKQPLAAPATSCGTQGKHHPGKDSLRLLRYTVAPQQRLSRTHDGAPYEMCSFGGEGQTACQALGRGCVATCILFKALLPCRPLDTTCCPTSRLLKQPSGTPGMSVGPAVQARYWYKYVPSLHVV